MPGTKAGGLKAAETNVKRHGSDFYKKIGAKGGAAGHTGGFQKGSQATRDAGRKGGIKSRRGSAATYPTADGWHEDVVEGHGL